MTAAVGMRGLSREKESSILARIRRHGRRAQARARATVRMYGWAAGCLVAALLAEAIDA